MTKHETADSMTSYAIGGGSVFIASLVEVATYAQSIAIILGCLVVAIRLVHDSVRLIRYLKEK